MTAPELCRDEWYQHLGGMRRIRVCPLQVSLRLDEFALPAIDQAGVGQCYGIFRAQLRRDQVRFKCQLILVFEDERIKRELVVEMDHHDGGKLKLVGNPVHLSDTPPAMRRPPPRLGFYGAVRAPHARFPLPAQH